MRTFPAGIDSVCRCGSYTFVEMLAVCAIVALVTALVIPGVTTGSRRIVTEQALSEVRRAFSETAMRARATGRPFALALLPESGEFLVREFDNQLDFEWQLPVVTGVDGGVLDGDVSYAVPSSVEWFDLPDGDGENGEITFFFFPDGEAAGPALDFELKGSHYRLVIDSVLGKATILEII